MNAPEAFEPGASGRSAPQVPLLRDPARSRMLDNFVADLLQLVSRENWTEAYRHAALVPMIAVALSDKSLRYSRDRYLEWCNRWVVLESDTAFEELCANAVSTSGLEDDVPRTALFQLRLRRHLRPVSGSALSYNLTLQSASAEAPSVAPVCVALASAMRSWYVEVGRRDDIVQKNLSRLTLQR